MIKMSLILDLPKAEAAEITRMGDLGTMTALELYQFGKLVRQGLKSIVVEIGRMPDVGPNPNLN